MPGNKIVIKKDSTIVVKLKIGQELNKREVELINSYETKDFLRLKKNRKTLEFNCKGLIPLTDYLRMNQMNKKMFAHILLAVVGAIKSCEADYLSLRLLTLSLQYTMIDPGTWHIYFLYVPVQPFEAPGDLKELLNEIIQYSVFDTSEETDYIQDYIRMINSGVIVPWQTIEEYANGLVAQLREETAENDRLCYHCNTRLEEDELVCPGCGISFKSVLFPGKASIEAYWESIRYVPGYGYESYDGYLNCRNQVEESEPELFAGIDDTGIISIFKPAGAETETACLVSAKGKIRSPITKTPFVVGKLQWETDLCLPEKTVSRKHASFHCENGEYYVSDLGSTNGTFVNGKKLESMRKVRLSDGDVIRLAREEFIFEYKKNKEN